MAMPRKPHITYSAIGAPGVIIALIESIKEIRYSDDSCLIRRTWANEDGTGGAEDNVTHKLAWMILDACLRSGHIPRVNRWVYSKTDLKEKEHDKNK